MAKKIQGYVKLNAPATTANPAKLGSTLGPTGVNIMEFCKQFNALTQNMEPDTPIPVVITIYADRSFTFIMKTPPVSFFLKKAANITAGSKEPGRAVAGKVSMEKIREIANIKMKDLNAHTIEAACEMIRGSARSMGLEVVEN